MSREIAPAFGKANDIVATVVICHCTDCQTRLKSGDPRLSMAERYPNAGDRTAAILKAAQQLVQDRLLLEEDAKLFIPSVNQDVNP
jgi:hypothetical protein